MMINTGYKLATAVTSTNTGSTMWTDPENLLLVDDQFAVSSGPTQTVTLGNFNHNIPVGSDILNITLRVKGYRGSFNTTLNLYAVDDTSGVELSYPYAPPFQGFDGTNTVWTLNPTLFATTWTVDGANNIKLTLIADGELHLDSAEIDILYDDNVTPAPTPVISGEVVCDEFVQALPFQLARAMTSADLYCFLTSFNYPSATGTGDPILLADFYDNAMLTIDQGKQTMENIRITSVDHDYQGTGQVRLGFTSLANRGLDFEYPYTSIPSRILAHTGTAEVVISNSAPFYDRFLKKCQIDALVSAPIEVLDEGAQLTPAAHSFNFTGGGVAATVVGQDVTVNIPGAGITPPVVVTTSSATTGNVQAGTLTWSHVSSGLNRLLLVQVSTEEAATITGITFDGNALTQEVSVTDVGNNLRSEEWSLVAPPVGTYNIVVTMSAPAYITAGAESFVSVDQATPVGVTNTNAANSNTPGLILTTGNNNSLVVDSLTTAQTPIVFTKGVAQDLNWRLTANTVTRQGGSSTEAAGTAPDNVAMDWSITQVTDWVMSAVEVRGLSTTLATLTVEDEGVLVDSSVAVMDFVGPGVVATQTAPGSVQITMSGITNEVGASVTQAAHGFSVGDIIRPSGVDNEFTLSQGNSPANSEAVGIVTVVTDVNNFEYVSSAAQLSGAFVPVAAGNTTVWLDPSVAGGMTTTEPATIGQVKRGLGTIIASGATMYFDIAALAEEITGTGGVPAIGGPITGGTSGSILFVNPNGIIAQDNANLYYDNIGKFVGVNNNTPAYPLDVTGDVHISGKLTVDGAIDPTSLTLVDAGNAAYFESADGGSAAVSPPNTGRLIYNVGTQEWQASMNGSAYGPFGGGITSINADTTAAQLIAAGTAGTDFAIATVAGTTTIDLPTASAVNRGALSTADWTAFDNKFDLPALTAGSVLFSDGTTIAQDNANLFWDNTNNWLGIGTAGPTAPLNIVTADPDGIVLYFTGTNCPLYIENAGAGASHTTCYLATNNGALGVWENRYHNSASPAVNDNIYRLLVTANDTIAAASDFAQMDVLIEDPTAGSEDGIIEWSVARAGSLTKTLGIKGSFNGIYVGDTFNTAYVKSNGNADLILETGNATTGTISILNGANADILIEPNGGGGVAIGKNSATGSLDILQPTLGIPVLTLATTATNTDPSEVTTMGRVATTNATVTTIDTIAVPATTTVALESIVIARRTGGAAGAAEDGARYKLSAVYKNVAGTATIIGGITQLADESVAGYDATFALTGGNVEITVTGVVNTNITWHSVTRQYAVST
jgi:hypothetical protein